MRIPGEVPVVVEAAHVDVHFATGRWRASGDVMVARGLDALRAHAAEYDPTADEILATGGATRARVSVALGGDAPVSVEADRVARATTGVLRATGSVQVTRGPDVVRAHEAEFDPVLGDIRAWGGETHPRVSAQVAGKQPATVEADRVTRSATGVVQASGGVQVTQEGETLRADEAVLDTATGEIAATGNVALTTRRGRVQGERVLYNVRTRAVSGGQVEAAVPSPNPEAAVTYHLKGETISGILKGEGDSDTPTEIRLAKGSFTTCDSARPHFSLDAREITLRPGERIVGKGVGISLFGLHLPTVPRIAMDLSGSGGDPGLFPHLSMGRTDGFGLRSDWQTTMPLGGATSGYAVLSARHTFRGGGGIDHFGAIPLGLRAGFKEDASSRFVSGLTLTVLPALTFYLPERWGPNGPLQIGLDRMPASQRMYSGDIDGGEWTGSRRWRLIAGGCAGRFTEHPTDVTADRLSLSGAMEVRPFRALPHLDLGAALRGRIGYYSTGTRYGVVSPEVSLRWQPSRRHLFLVEWRQQIARGTTPFFFDRIDAAQSVVLEWRNRTPRRGLGLRAELDAQSGGLYRWEASYSRRMECLQPGIVIRQHAGDLGIGFTLEIPGLSGGF